MKNRLRLFCALAFFAVITVLAYGDTGTLRLTINAGSSQNEVVSSMAYYGNYFSDSATNVDLLFYSDDIELYFEMFVPNGNNRLIAGTYRVSGNQNNDHGPFTFSYGEVDVADEEMIYDITGGAITINTTGAGTNMVYNISFDLNMEDMDGRAATMRGDYQGPIGWSDESN